MFGGTSCFVKGIFIYSPFILYIHQTFHISLSPNTNDTLAFGDIKVDQPFLGDEP